MLMADHTPITPTRRRALHFSATAIIAGLTAPMLLAKKAQVLPPADAELLWLCSRFHHQHQTALGTPDDDDDALFEEMGRRWAISDEISEIAASTDQGMRAKASVALVLLEENQTLERMDADVCFAYDTLRDLMGRGA